MKPITNPNGVSTQTPKHVTVHNVYLKHLLKRYIFNELLGNLKAYTHYFQLILC
jgi:hypothetical protein